MKRFLIFSATILLILFSACTTGSEIGGSLQPEKDIIHTDTVSFKLSSKTIVVDSIIQRNSTAILGEYTDARFGTTKADFLAQFYCADQFSFGDIPDHQIDSAFLYMFYESWFGDSTSLFETTVYHLNKAPELNQVYYTNLRIEDFCDKSEKLGSTVYTPISSKNQWTSSTKYCVRVSLDREFAQSIYDDCKADPSKCDGPRHFAEYLKGLYITTTYGNGALIYVSNAQLELVYDYRYTKEVDGKTVTIDTTAASYFPMTKEVKQINKYSHVDLSSYITTDGSDKDSLNYIYSPAGLYTQIHLPLSSVCRKLNGKYINYARLKLNATDLDDSSWGMNPPDKLLLIQEDRFKNFFAEYNLADNHESFVASYNKNDDCFIFDLSSLTQKLLRQYQEDETQPLDMTMIVLPVEEVTNGDNTSLYLLPKTKPSAVKIKSAAHPISPMKLEVVFTEQSGF